MPLWPRGTVAQATEHQAAVTVPFKIVSVPLTRSAVRRLGTNSVFHRLLNLDVGAAPVAALNSAAGKALKAFTIALNKRVPILPA